MRGLPKDAVIEDTGKILTPFNPVPKWCERMVYASVEVVEEIPISTIMDVLWRKGTVTCEASEHPWQTLMRGCIVVEVIDS
jgi:hypothetical protein